MNDDYVMENSSQLKQFTASMLEEEAGKETTLNNEQSSSSNLNLFTNINSSLTEPDSSRVDDLRLKADNNDLNVDKSFQNLPLPPCGVTAVVHFDDESVQRLEIYTDNHPNSWIPKRLECVGNHFPETLPPTEKKRHPSKLCVVCSHVTANSRRRPNGKIFRHETRYQCQECKVPICIAPRTCFRRYHTKMNYYIDDDEEDEDL